MMSVKGRKVKGARVVDLWAGDLRLARGRHGRNPEELAMRENRRRLFQQCRSHYLHHSNRLYLPSLDHLRTVTFAIETMIRYSQVAPERQSSASHSYRYGPSPHSPLTHSPFASPLLVLLMGTVTQSPARAPNHVPAPNRAQHRCDQLSAGNGVVPTRRRCSQRSRCIRCPCQSLTT